DSVNAAVGGSVTFTTSLTPTGTPLNYISWNKGTTNIVTSVAGDILINPNYKDRVTLNVLTGSLELRNLAVSDTGEYGVSITPTAGDASITGQATLNVYEPVTNVRITTNNTDLVEFNDTVRLSCSASGSSLSFLWFNDSVEVTASDRVRITDGGATLTIVTVLRYDQGSYTCEVSNLVSSNSSDEELSVGYGPEGVRLTISPSAEYYGEGSVVSFSCSADSRPEAQFRWFINGEMSSSTGAQINLVMEQSGNYSCRAFNSKTLRYTTSQPEEISVLMNVTEMISDALVSSSTQLPEEGTSLNVTCDASGSVSTREWMKNGSPLNSSENIIFYHQNQVLCFRSLSRKDSGRYSCNISNPVSSQEDTYYMVVTYGPENVEMSGSKEVQVQTAFRLSCSAESVPAASYVWIKNGTIIADSFEFTENLSEFSDSGEYICRATNDITMKTSEASHMVLITVNSFVKSSNPPVEGGLVYLTCDASECKLVQISVRLTISPSAEYYGEGSVVSFSCSADSRPEAQFRWFINGEMSSSTGAQINLVMEQSGNYSCQAFNSKTLRYTTSQPAEISPVSNVIIQTTNTDLVEFNNTVRLSCSGSGSSLSFLWFNDSVKVTASDRVRITDGGATLTIVTVLRYDQGSYTCEVSNPVSSSTSDEELLSVSYGPEGVRLTTSPSAEYYGEGSVVSFSCSADSRPEAQFRWFINGEMSSSTGAQINLKTCLIYRVCSFTENITNSSVLSFNPPVEGGSLNVTCDASGSIFTREWMKNGSPLNTSENIMFYHQNQVLSFRSLSRKDSGRYSCNISSKEVQVQTAFRLSCSAESVPAASYIWIKNGTIIADSFEFTENMSEFSDSGEYICRATNDITMKTSEASHMVLITGKRLHLQTLNWAVN
uniref:Ig-like domain-containing protein n=1 Tax=Neogobius melanostomus TaxID=47308 RepID=A0A8C6SJE3_9GOBI